MTSLALPAGTTRNPLRTLAWAGIVVGLVAAFVALPPVSSRSWVPSLLLALLAALAGIFVFTRGERRFGMYAVATALLAFGLAYLATRSSIGKLDTVVVWSALFAAMLRYATPLIFAALGGMFSERSGVVNIGLEGMMLTGAFFGILAADKLDSWELGLLVAILSGGAMALLHAVWSIHFRADQIISGFAVNFLALGLTGYLFIDIYGQEGTPSDIPSIPNIHLAFLDGVPFFGDIFGNLNLMIWIALILVPVSWFVLFRTPLGLRIRAVGEHPRAADTVGIDVYKIRYGAVVASGMLAARGRRVPLDRLPRLVQRGHDGRTGLHRARGGDLRQLAPVRRGGGLPPVRLLERPRAAPARVLGLGGRAVLGAPVRPDADRRRRRHRALDPAGGGRKAVPETVGTWPRTPSRVATSARPETDGRWQASSSGSPRPRRCRVAILATRYSGSYELLHAGFAIPLAVLLGAVAIGLARSALRLDDMRLGRAGGRRSARLGRALGVLGISLAATCAVALAVYGILTYLGER